MYLHGFQYISERWGFAAISFGYLQIAIGFIPMLYFVLGALSYILNWPELNTDPITKTIGALVILWYWLSPNLAELNILPRLRKSVFRRHLASSANFGLSSDQLFSQRLSIGH